MGAHICKQSPSNTFGEIKGIFVQYAPTLPDTQAENEIANQEIFVNIEPRSYEESDMVFKTKKNDIKRVDISSIKEQAQAISKAFKFKGLDQSLVHTLDLSTLEKGIIRQIVRKNLD